MKNPSATVVWLAAMSLAGTGVACAGDVANTSDRDLGEFCDEMGRRFCVQDACAIRAPSRGCAWRVRACPSCRPKRATERSRSLS